MGMSNRSTLFVCMAFVFAPAVLADRDMDSNNTQEEGGTDNGGAINNSSVFDSKLGTSMRRLSIDGSSLPRATAAGDQSPTAPVSSATPLEGSGAIALAATAALETSASLPAVPLPAKADQALEHKLGASSATPWEGPGTMPLAATAAVKDNMSFPAALGDNLGASSATPNEAAGSTSLAVTATVEDDLSFPAAFDDKFGASEVMPSEGAGAMSLAATAAVQDVEGASTLAAAEGGRPASASASGAPPAAAAGEGGAITFATMSAGAEMTPLAAAAAVAALETSRNGTTAELPRPSSISTVASSARHANANTAAEFVHKPAAHLHRASEAGAPHRAMATRNETHSSQEHASTRGQQQVDGEAAAVAALASMADPRDVQMLRRVVAELAADDAYRSSHRQRRHHRHGNSSRGPGSRGYRSRQLLQQRHVDKRGTAAGAKGSNASLLAAAAAASLVDSGGNEGYGASHGDVDVGVDYTLLNGTHASSRGYRSQQLLQQRHVDKRGTAAGAEGSNASLLAEAAAASLVDSGGNEGYGASHGDIDVGVDYTPLNETHASRWLPRAPPSTPPLSAVELRARESEEPTLQFSSELADLQAPPPADPASAAAAVPAGGANTTASGVATTDALDDTIGDAAAAPAPSDPAAAAAAAPAEEGSTTQQYMKGLAIGTGAVVLAGAGVGGAVVLRNRMRRTAAAAPARTG